MEACSSEWQERLSAWFDGEAEEREVSALKTHLSGCAGCTRELAGFESLRSALKAEASEEAAVSDALRRRVTRLASPSRPTYARRRWLGAVGAVAASVALLWGTWPGGMNESLAMDLERHHLKAFSRATPCEFESSDPAAVGAWIARELGYEVNVPVVPGATLLGARKCKLHGQLSASLLYRHGDRALTLFLPPPGSSAAKEAAQFAEDGPKCTQGPVGEQICVATRGEGAPAAVAVSELEQPVLLEALAQVAN